MAERRAKNWLSQREKAERAFASYLELMDAADFMRARVYNQLATFDLTIRGFRVLELLHREGPRPAVGVAGRFGWTRQNLDFVLKGLAENGWVAARRSSVRQMEELGVEVPDGDGRPLVLLVLTKAGTAFAKQFLPRHAKVVKAYMRALDGRQQQTLAELCRKLRKGDAKKFISEMSFKDLEE
jgi:DNA-binding MarR family transcriptional regulator